ncbi:MAG: hypothetical protein ABIT37_17245 [Luteolibacter sp.]
MKLVLIALSLISCGIAAGNSERLAQIRVCLQFIEVPHATLTEMLAGHETSGQALHDKAIALAKDGRAKLMETCMVVCRSGQKATLESIREEIYPTEYAPPELPCGNLSNVRLASDPPANPLFRSPTAFDTRNTGVTFEVESTLSANGAIDLRLSPEIVTPLRLETWMEHVDQWGDGSIRMPIYESWRVNTSISVESGKFELVSALTPKANAPVPAVSRKILVFVRADILPAP